MYFFPVISIYLLFVLNLQKLILYVHIYLYIHIFCLYVNFILYKIHIYKSTSLNICILFFIIWKTLTEIRIKILHQSACSFKVFILKYNAQLLLSTMQRNRIPRCSSSLEMDVDPILQSCVSQVASVRKLLYNYQCIFMLSLFTHSDHSYFVS